MKIKSAVYRNATQAVQACCMAAGRTDSMFVVQGAAR